MFKIYDGRLFFYQWDLNRKLIIKDDSIKEVHFCNRTEDCSLVCEVYTENGVNLVNVPNILLQKCFCLNVYAYDGEATKHSAKFNIMPRSKPADYVYTETEVKKWEDYAAEVEAEVQAYKAEVEAEVQAYKADVKAEVEEYKAEVEAYIDAAKAEIQGGLNEIDYMLTGFSYPEPMKESEN
jgi:hypothetical protein